MPCQTLEMQCKDGRVVMLRNKDDMPRFQKCNAKRVELNCQELRMLSQESRVDCQELRMLCLASRNAMPKIKSCIVMAKGCIIAKNVKLHC